MFEISFPFTLAGWLCPPETALLPTGRCSTHLFLSCWHSFVWKCQDKVGKRDQKTLSRCSNRLCWDSVGQEREPHSFERVEVSRKENCLKIRWQQTGIAMQGNKLYRMFSTDSVQCQGCIWRGYCSSSRTEQCLWQTYSTVCWMHYFVT